MMKICMVKIEMGKEIDKLFKLRLNTHLKWTMDTAQVQLNSLVRNYFLKTVLKRNMRALIDE